ncbi:MAG: transcription-repair coupling factor [Saccharofermentanales bacterium]
MREISSNDLLSIASGDPQYKKLLALLDSGGRQFVNVNGPPDSLKNFLLSALCRDSGRSAVVVVSDELRARALQAGLRSFGNADTPIFRQREYNLIDADASSRDVEFERLAVLHGLAAGNSGIYIVTAGASLSRLMPVSVFRTLTTGIRSGMSMDPELLCCRLLAAGYERVKITDAPGQFSRRGDIVDIILPGEIRLPPSERTGIRISFFGDEIDALKCFDLSTQRSVEMLREATVYPAREVVIPPEKVKEVSSEIMVQGGGMSDPIRHHDSERISQGIHFSGADRYIPLIYGDADMVFDYAEPGRFFIAIDEISRVKDRMDSRLADFYEGFKSLLEKGRILPCSEGILFRPSEVFIKLDKRPELLHFAYLLSSGNGLPGAKEVKIAGRESGTWRGHENRLADDIADLIRTGLRPVISAGNAERQQKLSAMLADKNVYPEFVNLPVKTGFDYTGAGLVLIGEEQIFGAQRSVKKKHSKGISIDLFSDLKTGDPVVHELHGIGRYCGLSSVETGGMRRDYLKIEYAAGDSLYISTDNLDQIQKYVGSEGREPKLSKLGGQDWYKLKEKAHSSIRTLATNLIRLYAERMAIQGFAFSPDTVWQREFEDSFMYEDTSDQDRSTREIKEDMESSKVMDRLLCGDVGFGKTEVAFRAVFKCVMDGKQAAILVPTTVLAQQHYETLTARLRDFPVKVGLLSRFASDAMIKETRRKLATGELEIVIGTHRILSEDVRFKNPGLLVIDEEQRFGVDHKEKLKELFPSVDVLTLTATPIPRTLHMSMSGIRDISVLEEPPPDRRPVQTYVMEYDPGIVAEAMLREISRKGQVFYLFNNTSRMPDKAAEIEKMLPGARVTFAHGKMKEKELEDVIEEFIHGNADILVCTTIIESGIDMPNVNTIIVENAERFGLSQLYQLKGRVGRSDRQAYAYITYRQDKVLTEIAEKRLSAIRDFTELGSGFKIALRDLEVRGAGNLLGAEQHGNLDSIGYDLYCRMLEEEIAGQTGRKKEKIEGAVVEIDVDAYIPAEYVPEEGERMDMYRRIAQITDVQSYMDVVDEITDRYGDAPANVITLARISFIRNHAGRCGFSRVWIKGDSVVLTYREGAMPDMEALANAIGSPEHKGQILFNAGTKPYVVLRHAAKDLGKTTANVYKALLLFVKN